MKAPQPILTAELFAPLDGELIPLLRGLSPSDWEKPTVCRGWCVKDVAAHLLDTALRRLSIHRDGYWPKAQVDLSTPQKLAAFINQLNARWVEATRPLSPALLTELLESTGAELSRFFVSLDPFARAPFGVSWAGEQESANWFDTAREYTERWHHQQQIRDATGRPPLIERRFLFPVLDTFMRALPYAFRNVNAADGTLWEIRLQGEAGGSWFLLRRAEQWQLGLDAERAAGVVSLPQDAAWRLFTKGIAAEQAKQQVRSQGPQELADGLLNMLCIVA